MRSIVLLPLSLAAGLATGFAFFRGPTPLSRVEEVARRAAGATGDPHAWGDSPGATDAKAQRLIAAALRKGDRLECRDELYLAIEQLTADDFHRLITDLGALKAMAEKLSKADWQTSQVLASGLIARWLAVDPGTVMTWAPRMLELVPKDQNARGLILDALAAKRPEEMLALVPTRKDTGERAEIISRALRELAMSDLPKARAWLEKCTDPADRREAEKAVRSGTVRADPLRVVEIAGSIPDRNEGVQLLQAAAASAEKAGMGTLRALAATPMEPWMLAQLTAVVADHDPALSVDLALKVCASPNSPKTQLQWSFSALTRRDPQEAIGKLENLTGPQLATAVSSIGAAWAETDPATALEWLSGRPKAERADPNYWGAERDPLLRAFSSWAGRAQGEAAAWAEALPVGETRDAVEAQLAQVLVAHDQPAEATQLLARLGSSADPKAFASVAGAWAAHDPQAAADWAIAQPAGPAQSRALASVVGRWANDDPQGVGDWLAQFPAGEARDRSVAAYMGRNSAWTETSTERIAEFDAWFDLIDDPWQRAQAATQSFWGRKNSDPVAARAWLSSLSNLDPEVVRLTLRGSLP